MLEVVRPEMAEILKNERNDMSAKEIIHLGSPCLAQFESAKRNMGEAEGSRFAHLLLGEGNSTEKTGRPEANEQMQQVEEELSRKAALVEKEKRALAELAKEKYRMEQELQAHQDQLAKTNQKLIEVQKLLEIHKDYGYGGSQNSQTNEEAEDEELVDYTDNQVDGDGQGSQQAGLDPDKITDQEEVPDAEQQNNKIPVPYPRRCHKLKDKELKKVENLAIDRAKAKDNMGKCTNGDSSFLSNDNVSLFQVASTIGINLGVAIDMVDHNIGLLKDLEQARIDLYSQQHRTPDLGCSTDADLSKIGDKILDELLVDLDEKETLDERVDIDGFQMAQGKKKKNKKQKNASPVIVSVKALLKNKKGKK